MTPEDITKQLRAFGKRTQDLYAVWAQSPKPLTQGEAQKHLPGFKPRSGWWTEERRNLEYAGLIRRQGKSRGHQCWIATAPDEVEEFREINRKHNRHKATPTDRTTSTQASRRIGAIRAENAAGYTAWSSARLGVNQAITQLVRVSPMMLSEAGPSDEIDMLVDDLTELCQWILDISDEIDKRRHNDAIKDKIEKMNGNLAGRTVAEQETIRNLAARHATKLYG